MKCKAFAKINLTLAITGIREDGYHTLHTVMQQVSLHDDLTVEKADTITFTCTDEAVNLLADLSYSAEYGARNIRRIVQSEIEDKAVRILCDTFGIPEALSVSVKNGEIRVELTLK